MESNVCVNNIKKPKANLSMLDKIIFALALIPIAVLMFYVVFQFFGFFGLFLFAPFAALISLFGGDSTVVAEGIQHIFMFCLDTHITAILICACIEAAILVYFIITSYFKKNTKKIIKPFIIFGSIFAALVILSIVIC